MIVLGVIDNHDSGVVLSRDGKIVFAVNEERLNREKITRRFPEQSIALALRYTKTAPRDVQEVVVGTRITPPFLLRFFNRSYSRGRSYVSCFSYSLNVFYLWQVMLSAVPVFEKIDVFLSSLFYRFKFARLGIRCPITFVDHHFAHACSAFYTSGREEALVVTMDGMGDSRGLTVSLGRGRELTYALYHETGFSAITTYFLRLTEFLGFRPLLHEGKVMALAAYGNPERTAPLLRNLLRCEEGKFSKTNFLLRQTPHSRPYEALRSFAREDIAAGAQYVLEEAVCALVRYWIGKTGLRHLVLAGGTFANIKLNQKLAALPEVASVYIFPHMGDGGLAAGAALSRTVPVPETLADVFWGPEYPDEEIAAVLRKNAAVEFRRVPDIDKQAGLLLSQHKLVARFTGRMEFGPRALGNRSILYEATDPAIKRRLNEMLGRMEFMPFAPVLQYEDRDKYFLNTEKASYTAEFLNISFEARPETRTKYPGIVHVDGTVRPQFVRKEKNPRLHALLGWYREFSGQDMLINTSFNMHEEPIVCTPEDALSAFLRARLDHLVLEDYLVSARDAGAAGPR